MTAAHCVRRIEVHGLSGNTGNCPRAYRRYDERHLARLNFIRHSRTPDIPPEERQLLAFDAGSFEDGKRTAPLVMPLPF